MRVSFVYIIYHRHCIITNKQVIFFYQSNNQTLVLPKSIKPKKRKENTFDNKIEFINSLTIKHANNNYLISILVVKLLKKRISR